VERQVRLTLSQGAELVCGGRRRGTFYDATIIDGVTAAMDIAHNMEIFGPVVPVMGTDTLDEALALANDTDYGLGGGVITSDIKKAFKAAASLDSGTVVIDGSGNYRFAHHPFGGHKKSGIGHEGVSRTLEEMSQLKTVVLKKKLPRE
jgi:succinate-semialdehyde dehydrogenase/glutarate-semialdehyde dehydrogenase